MAVYKTVSTGASSTQRVIVSISGEYGWDRSDSGGVLIRVNGVDRCSSRGDYWTSFNATFELAVGTATVVVEYYHGKVNYCDVSIQLIETEFSITTTAGTGGTLAASAQRAIIGTTITLTPTPNSGYQFSSYSDKVPSNLAINNNQFTMPGQNVSVKANFSKRTYNISANGNPAAGGTATVSKATGQIGDVITVSHSDNTGYTFKGFTSSPANLISNNKFTMPASNVTVTANYTHNEYTITKTSSPTAGGTVTVGKTKAYYNDEVTVSATPSAGYRFVKWQTSPSLTISSGKFTMPNGNVSITAVFEKITYSISANGNPAAGGTATVSKATGQIGDVITVSHSDNTGYTFKGFTSSPANLISNNKFTMPASNVTVTANYTHNEYAITGTPSPAAGGSITLGKTKAYYNDAVTVSATPATGYRFVRWQTSPSVTIANGKFNMPNENISVTAVFEKIPRAINYNVNPANSGQITSDHGGTAEYGDVVTLSYTEQNGYLFDSYSSDDVTITNGKFTMPNKDVTIVGNFYPGRSTCTLDKSAYTGGETAVLTINAERAFFAHKYRLNFGLGMDTGFVDVPAGTYSVSIYIPLEWSKFLESTPKTGGVLTLQTYNGKTLTGEYEITGISYAARGGTIPKLKLSRAKESGAYKLDGVRATYEIAIPAGVSSYKLIYGDESVSAPAATGFIIPGSKKVIPLEQSDVVTLEITYGKETFRLMESVPAVVIINKNVNPES